MMKTHSIFSTLTVLVVLVSSQIAFATNPSSVDYAIAPTLLNAGIGSMTSTNYYLASSLGAPVSTAPVYSANYRIGFGLWPVAPSLAAAVLVKAVSRRHHGGAGDFDLALSLLATDPTVEPRQGPGATLVLTFDKPVTGANIVVTSGTATYGGMTISGTDAILTLTGVANAQYVTVAASNVTSEDGQTGGTGSVRVGFLVGDVSGNRVVTLSDLLQVNAVLAQSVTAGTFLRDINLSGTLSLADLLTVNANLAQGLPAP
jgi:hypothetical protein